MILFKHDKAYFKTFREASAEAKRIAGKQNVPIFIYPEGEWAWIGGRGESLAPGEREEWVISREPKSDSYDDAEDAETVIDRFRLDYDEDYRDQVGYMGPRGLYDEDWMSERDLMIREMFLGLC